MADNYPSKLLATVFRNPFCNAFLILVWNAMLYWVKVELGSGLGSGIVGQWDVKLGLGFWN